MNFKISKKNKLWFIFIIIITIFIIWVYWDNNRFIVQDIEINHPKVPEEFNGYKILQITDLHGKKFGHKQSKLIKKINSLNYDIVLLTGDYVNDYNSIDTSAILELIDGIKKDKPIYYIWGNQLGIGQYVYEYNENGSHLKEAFEKRGLKQVYPFTKITRNKQSIWLTKISYDKKTELQQIKKSGFQQNKDFNITVLHRPIDYNVLQRLKDINTNTNDNFELDYSISIAGHTHGGQIRLPFIGAIITPNGSWFPSDEYIYGIHKDCDGRVNYISSGLGAGGAWWHRFRLFNTPEISIITIKK